MVLLFSALQIGYIIFIVLSFLLDLFFPSSLLLSFSFHSHVSNKLSNCIVSCRSKQVGIEVIVFVTRVPTFPGNSWKDTRIKGAQPNASCCIRLLYCFEFLFVWIFLSYWKSEFLVVRGVRIFKGPLVDLEFYGNQTS